MHTEILVCGKRFDCASSVVLVDLVKPCDTSFVVLWSRLPVLTMGKRYVSQSHLVPANREKIKLTVRTSSLYPLVFALHRC